MGREFGPVAATCEISAVRALHILAERGVLKGEIAEVFRAYSDVEAKAARGEASREALLALMPRLVDVILLMRPCCPSRRDDSTLYRSGLHRFCALRKRVPMTQTDAESGETPKDWPMVLCESG